jgi:hypothetical protein
MYAVAGSEEHVALDMFVGGHRWNGERAYGWVEKWL